jgi:hypothetical protein
MLEWGQISEKGGKSEMRRDYAILLVVVALLVGCIAGGFCGYQIASQSGRSTVTPASVVSQSSYVGTWVVRYPSRDVVLEFLEDGTGSWQGQPSISFSCRPDPNGNSFTAIATMPGGNPCKISGKLSTDGKHLVITGFGDGWFASSYCTTIFERL